MQNSKSPKEKVVIDYLSIHERIPRTASQDPNFQELGIEEAFSREADGNWVETERDKMKEGSILSVFTPQEVVAMVNRYLYQIEYQRDWHRRWERERSESLGPVKKKVREMFKVSFGKATEGQIQKAINQLRKEKEEKE